MGDVDFSNSEAWFLQATPRLPGGVNSPVRSFQAVAVTPVFIERGEGAYVYDVDGNGYIDYVGSYGPMFLGHAYPKVVEAIVATAKKSTSFGAPSPLEVELAKLVQEFLPSLEMMRFVNSGTEATMSAVRLARGYTGRSKLVKFTGCYHGHGDSFLVKAGSGALTFGVPDSAGVPKGIAELTISLPFNDIEAIGSTFAAQGEEIAAVILEIVPGNMGVIKPDPAFLAQVQLLCRQSGALLIADEVMTGFRVAPGGAQGLYDLDPDLTTFGKIVGGGLPVGAYGGRKRIMEYIAPLGPVYQAGTLSGNPLAMAAGLATLSELADHPEFYSQVERQSERLTKGLQELFADRGMPVWLNRVGSMYTLFFQEGPVTDFASATRSDTKLFATFFRHALQAGINLPPSQYEAVFLSIAHQQSVVDLTLERVAEILRQHF